MPDSDKKQVIEKLKTDGLVSIVLRQSLGIQSWLSLNSQRSPIVRSSDLGTDGHWHPFLPMVAVFPRRLGIL